MKNLFNSFNFQDPLKYIYFLKKSRDKILYSFKEKKRKKYVYIEI